jgi:hypothetical protein
VAQEPTQNKLDIFIRDDRRAVPRVTGIELTNDGHLFKDGVEVDAVSISTAISEFLKWLAGMDTKVILMAHNCKHFNGKLLMQAATVKGKTNEYERLVQQGSD